MVRPSFVVVPLLFAILFAGCGDQENNTSTENGSVVDPALASTDSGAEASAGTNKTDGEKSDAAANKSAAAEKPMRPMRVIPTRDTLSGNWLMYRLHMAPPQQKDAPPQIGEQALLLLTLNGDAKDGQPLVSVVAGRFGFENFKIGEPSLKDGVLQFQLVGPGGDTSSFRGTFKNGLVAGSLILTNGTSMPLRLIPTVERTFARISLVDPLPEVAEMERLMNSPVFDADAREVIASHPTSPVNRMIWSRLMELAAKNSKPGSTDLEKVINEYTDSQGQLDTRLGIISDFECLTMMLQQGFDLDWCNKRVDHIEARLATDETLAPLKASLEPMRRSIRFRRTFKMLDSQDKNELAEGRKEAEELLKIAPYDPNLLVRLADAAREDGDTDRAIRLYAELATLPLMERILQQQWANDSIKHILPSERLATLWQEKHGKADGLDEFRQKVYDESLLSFVEPAMEKRPNEGTHTVLLELFTGTRSLPSVASAVAIAGLEKTEPKGIFVALRYHLHIPGPDPLTSEDSEARFFNYYRVDGTPALFLDGIPLANVAGLMDQAPGAYRNLKKVVEGDSAEKSEAKIDVSATRQDDKIKVSAAVSGVDFGNSQLRLRIALAESDITYEALTGIRHHSMVVRSMLGGDQGIAPAEGALKFESEVSLDDVRQRIHKALTQLEKNQGVTFEKIPLELKNLSVVAFVQDDATRKVLQTVVVPIAE